MNTWEKTRELHTPARGYEQAKKEGYVPDTDGMKTCGNCRYGMRSSAALTACHMFEFWAATPGVCNEWDRERA